MAKIKRSTDVDCPHVLCPLGKGLPLCCYTLWKEKRMATAKLQDFPMCDPKKCPKEKDEQKEGPHAK